MRRDMKSNVDVAASINPADQAASANGSTVDLRGYDSAIAIVVSGAITAAGNYTVKLQHGDASDGSDAADCAAGDLTGAFSASVAANSVERVGYIGTKRYIRAVITKNSGTSVVCGVAVARTKGSVVPLA